MSNLRVNLSEGELATLTPEEYAAWKANQFTNVYGSNFQRDAHGRPVEAGIGSPGNETANHWAAMRKYDPEGYARLRVIDTSPLAKAALKKDHVSADPPVLIVKPKRKGNPAGLAKARAAKAAKLAAEKGGA